MQMRSLTLDQFPTMGGLVENHSEHRCRPLPEALIGTRRELVTVAVIIVRSWSCVPSTSSSDSQRPDSTAPDMPTASGDPPST
jgi:hypothetical protein